MGLEREGFVPFGIDCSDSMLALHKSFTNGAAEGADLVLPIVYKRYDPSVASLLKDTLWMTRVCWHAGDVHGMMRQQAVAMQHSCCWDGPAVDICGRAE